ncbi:HEPN domain-containing protein [Gimesia chilikensis]|uniref:ApeA N-terminal domain 1-containing protein n=1 Tax=Gimesia chilikensis TaxID=2605989 RepID=UPI001189C10E|nr:HEPN domain-containing protein [Gimesia chilikensis]QDT85165.1 hypothetical protein MalM14_28320 [Gimesia chilikensis]
MSRLIKEDSIFDEIKVEGEWWLPDTPDKSSRGTLIGKESEDFVLTTFEDLEQIDDPFSANQNYELIILGESKEGELYTLLLCFNFNHPISRLWKTKTTDYYYTVNRIVVGAHFHSYRDLSFDKIAFGISNLEEWHCASAFKEKWDSEKHCVELTYNRPQTVTILDNENISARIEYCYQTITHEAALKSATIKHVARIVIQSKQSGIPLEDYDNSGKPYLFDYVSKIISFIKFGVQKEIYSYDLTVYIDEIRNQIDPKYDYPMRLYRMIRPNSDLTPKHYSEMLFSWRNVASTPQEYFQKWLDITDDIKMPLSLYFSSFDLKSDKTIRFLQLVQGLEGYHRARYQEQSIPSEYHLSVVEKILEACPEDKVEISEGKKIKLKKWLKSQLSHSHEPSLENRLQQLFNKRLELVKWLTEETENKPKTMNKFAALIATKRNDFSHRFIKEKIELTNDRLVQTIILMRLVFVLLFLEELGFTNDQIKGIFLNHSETKHFRQLLSKYPME